MPRKYEELTGIAPELIAIWDTALERGELEIPCETDREAQSLQTRLYSVRKALQKQKYENSALLDRLEINRKASVLRIRFPTWLRYTRNALEAVGKKAPVMPDHSDLRPFTEQAAATKAEKDTAPEEAPAPAKRKPSSGPSFLASTLEDLNFKPKESPQNGEGEDQSS